MELDLRSFVRLSAFGALVGIVVAGCSGATGPPTPKTIVNPGDSVAQIAVGTANIYGGASTAVVGLNVTSTMRTPDGNSVLLSTPYITGPFKLPATLGVPDGTGSTIETGPTATEVATESITSTPQVPPGTVNIPPSSFGVSGGDFANGFLPQNAGNAGNVSFNPYVQPLYDALLLGSSGDPNIFVPWGGPPAFDPNHDGQGTRDGTFGPGLLGVTEGINVFYGVTVNPGVYNLRVVIPTQAQNYQVSGQFTLPGIVLLGNATAPKYAPDGNGGGSFAVTMPTGATDALLGIVDLGLPPTSSGGQGGNCNGAGDGGPSSAAPVYYTIHVSGTAVYKLPDTDGPGNPTHRHPSICTAAQNGSGAAADVIQVQLIGADYPLYADQYLFNLSQQSPSIVGSGGSNDLTISTIGDGTTAGTASHRRAVNYYVRRALRGGLH